MYSINTLFFLNKHAHFINIKFIGSQNPEVRSFIIPKIEFNAKYNSLVVRFIVQELFVRAELCFMPLCNSFLADDRGKIVLATNKCCPSF